MFFWVERKARWVRLVCLRPQLVEPSCGNSNTAQLVLTPLFHRPTLLGPSGFQAKDSQILSPVLLVSFAPCKMLILLEYYLCLFNSYTMFYGHCQTASSFRTGLGLFFPPLFPQNLVVELTARCCSVNSC